jgi:hypothetical protein
MRVHIYKTTKVGLKSVGLLLPPSNLDTYLLIYLLYLLVVSSSLQCTVRPRPDCFIVCLPFLSVPSAYRPAFLCLSVCRPAWLLPAAVLSVYSQSAVSSVCRLSNSTCSVSCLFCLSCSCLSVCLYLPANLAVCVVFLCTC